jgi:hypothetical protein
MILRARTQSAAFYPGHSGQSPLVLNDIEPRYTGRRPPDQAYRGIFYFNPDDPALLVPKRFGIGYTLNFGNPWSWAVLALIILTVALPFILTAVNVRHLPR